MKKTFLAAAVALGALTISLPAHADPRGNESSYNQRSDYRGPERGDYRGEYRGPDRNDQRGAYRHTFGREDIQRLQARIDRGYESGRLTRREAERLTWQVNDLRQRARFYWRTDGMSWRERQDIDVRYVRVRDAVRYQMHDDDTRYGDNRGPRRS
ncbi:MAG: hypothetical protein SGJ23_12890 [Alphaproteobacteria bacterium]|nr:hypothetical protein [Alphaproteobacteria bacterium]